MVGVTGFEPAASSSRTKRATKLRNTPKASSRIHERSAAHDQGSSARGRYDAAVSVTSDASGRQAKRTGAKIDVPSPADTLRYAERKAWRQTLRPLTCARGMSQLVTSAPNPGTHTWPPWVWPAKIIAAP